MKGNPGFRASLIVKRAGRISGESGIGRQRPDVLGCSARISPTMRRAWMPSFVVLVLAAAGIIHARAAEVADAPQFVVPDVPDLTIKTRETVDHPRSTVRTSTLYFKGAWQRRELHLDFPSAVPGPRTMRHIAITRCDERRSIEVNDDARLYASSALDFLGRDVYWVRSHWWRRTEPTTSGAEVKIIVDTVDTGERRQVGSYSARHVITTTTTNPARGANTRPSETVEDGWDIDLPSAGCWNIGDRHAFLASGSVVRPGGVPDRVNVEVRGSARRGFTIEGTSRTQGRGQAAMTATVKLIEFSHAVLDRSLFDVPAGYRPALPRLVGGFDMTRPDTIANRVAVYWEDVTRLARDFLRF